MKNIILGTIIFTGASFIAMPTLASNSPDTTMASAPSSVVGVAPDCSREQRGRFSLTDDQLEKLHAARLQYSTSNAPKMAQLKILQEQLTDTLSKAVVDKGAALSIQGEINGLKDDLANARVSMTADTSTIFTPNSGNSSGIGS